MENLTEGCNAPVERAQNRVFVAGQKKDKPAGLFCRNDKIVSTNGPKNNPAGYFDELCHAVKMTRQGYFLSVLLRRFYRLDKITRPGYPQKERVKKTPITRFWARSSQMCAHFRKILRQSC